MTLGQERELLERIRSDRQEFGTLFDHYYKPIFGYLYRRTGAYDLSKDMAAETFLKAFLNIDQFVWKGVPLSSWLYRIATNEANQFFRKKKYRAVTMESLVDLDLAKLIGNDEERIILERELEEHGDFIKVQQALTNLDVRYQEVIALRYFENRDNREIGMILGKPEGTIKSLLSRGLEKLRQALK